MWLTRGWERTCGSYNTWLQIQFHRRDPLNAGHFMTMAQQDGNAEEGVNGKAPEGDPKPDGALSTPSSNPDTSSIRQSTVGQPSNAVTNTPSTSARENDTGLNNQSDLSELAGDPKMPLEGFDWADLERRYHESMQECGKAEQEICDEFGKWVRVCNFGHHRHAHCTETLKVFDAWASTTIVQENERSSKRCDIHPPMDPCAYLT